MHKTLISLLLILFLTACVSNVEQDTVIDSVVDLSEGTVIIISNGEEIEPYKSWSRGSTTDKDGKKIEADAIQISQRGINDSLETITYSDNFEIKITGDPMSIKYRIYTDDFGLYENSPYLSSDITMPSENGIYIIRVEVKWRVSDGYTAYDYVFRLLIE